MNHRRTLATAIAVAVCASTIAAASVSARVQHPQVVAGYRDGPETIPPGTGYARLAALKVPRGRWIAWAKLYVSGGTPSVSRCRLRSTGVNGKGHGASVQVHPPDSGLPSIQPMALSTSAEYGAGGGNIILECGTIQGGATDAQWMKIVAMRVGTLKWASMLPSQNVVTSGSGTPTAILGHRSGPVELPPGTTRSLGEVRLGAGAWAVRASFSIDQEIGAYSTCRLLIGGTEYDRAFTETDQFGVVTVLETATRLPRAAKARVSCTGDSYLANQGDPGTSSFVSSVRITAIKLGSLVTFGNGQASKWGSGAPLAKFKAARVVDLVDGQWTKLRQIALGTGNWMVLAKTQVKGSEVTCQLGAGVDVDFDLVGSWAVATLPLEVVHGFTRPGQVLLRCRAQPWGDNQFDDVARNVSVTAFRVGTLTNTQLE